MPKKMSNNELDSTLIINESVFYPPKVGGRLETRT
jgi:hypothetical protein